MNKILVITYYWPPHAGVGVQRWLKFVKYLPDYGWQPTVFTPENAAFDLEDHQLMQEIPDSVEVIRFPIWEPFGLFKKLSGKKSRENLRQGLVLEKKNKGWLDRTIIYLRGNLFIPDPRVFWVKPSVKFLKDLIESNQFQAVVTTGPPHSVHLIGLGLKKKTGIKWLADFRDPWSNWDLLNQLKVNRISRSIHRKLELKTLVTADAVTTVSRNLKEDLALLGGKKVYEIKNGVDIESINLDFTDVSSINKFRISYMGLLNKMRNPQALWKALEELMMDNHELANDLELYLAGIISENILNKLENSPLKSILNYKSYIPHQQVFKENQQAALLIVILNNTDNARWIIPGKLYEYLIARRFILLLGPENCNAGEVIHTAQTGASVAFDNKEKIKNIILERYKAFKSGMIVTNPVNIEQYSRRNLTGELSEILHKL